MLLNPIRGWRLKDVLSAKKLSSPPIPEAILSPVAAESAIMDLNR